MKARATVIVWTLALIANFSGTPAEGGEGATHGLVLSGINVVGGELGAAALLIDPLLAEQVQSGDGRFLLEIRLLDDPLVQDDPEIEVASFPGIDLDGDPSDDFDGNEIFEVDPIGLSADGTPLTIFTPGSITAGALLAGPATLDLGNGVAIPDAMLEGTVESGGGSFLSDSIESAIPAAVFDAIPAPPPFDAFPFNYTTLTEVFAFFNINPDVDIDGDGTFDAFSVEFALAFVSCQIVYPTLENTFRRGDTNADSVIDIADPVGLLQHLFTGGPAPACADSGDTNDDGSVDIADAVLVLSHLFIGGVPPQSPYPDCGVDPVDDALDCGVSTGGCL